MVLVLQSFQPSLSILWEGKIGSSLAVEKQRMVKCRDAPTPLIFCNIGHYPPLPPLLLSGLCALLCTALLLSYFLLRTYKVQIQTVLAPWILYNVRDRVERCTGKPRKGKDLKLGCSFSLFVLFPLFLTLLAGSVGITPYIETYKDCLWGNKRTINMRPRLHSIL